MRSGICVAVLATATVINAADAELPRVLIDTTYRTPSGSTTAVNSGGNLQTAINNASCGDILSLEAGATFTGNFTLPDKDCAAGNYVVIRTATPDGTFPRPGNRVGPSHASLMAKLTAGSGAIITSNSDADHYRLIGLEITPSAYVNALIELSGGQGNLATQTNNIIIDRCYIHGHATNGSRRGVSAQGAYIAVIDSYLSDFKEVGADTQAIASWNGSGPFKIVNNYLEGAGENVMFGGADSASADFIPSDIEIRRNHFYKPLSWWPSHGSYGGTAWTVKNILELKSARRVLIEGNLFENVWEGGQNGFALVYTVRNQEGSADWSTVEDVTTRGNWVRHAGQCINFLGWDDTYPAGSEIEYRLDVKHNLYTDIGESWSTPSHRCFQAIAPMHDLRITNNTLIRASASLNNLYAARTAGAPETDLTDAVFSANIGEGALTGDATSPGNSTISEYFTGQTITDNLFIGQTSGDYPANNDFPATTGDVGFENYAGGDYRLATSSSYDGTGAGGSDIGAWIPAATAAGSQLDWKFDRQCSGTSCVLRFGVPGLPSDTSCTVRYGSSTATSTSGGAIRTVVVTGLTNTQEYFLGVDCGTTWGGWLAWENFTAATPSGGDRTVSIGIGDPANASVTRCTVDYDDNAALSSPTSVQDTSCGSGGEVSLTVPAGVTYWRVRHQDGSDTVLATGSVQALLVE